MREKEGVRSGRRLGEGLGEAAQTPGAGAERERVRVHALLGRARKPCEQHLERCGPGARRAAGALASACQRADSRPSSLCSRSGPPCSLPSTPPSPPMPEEQKRGCQASTTQAGTRAGTDGCCGARLRANPSPGPCMCGPGHALRRFRGVSAHIAIDGPETLQMLGLDRLLAAGCRR